MSDMSPQKISFDFSDFQVVPWRRASKKASASVARSWPKLATQFWADRPLMKIGTGISATKWRKSMWPGLKNPCQFYVICYMLIKEGELSNTKCRFHMVWPCLPKSARCSWRFPVSFWCSNIGNDKNGIMVLNEEHMFGLTSPNSW